MKVRFYDIKQDMPGDMPESFLVAQYYDKFTEDPKR